MRSGEYWKYVGKILAKEFSITNGVGPTLESTGMRLENVGYCVYTKIKSWANNIGNKSLTLLVNVEYVLANVHLPSLDQGWQAIRWHKWTI